MSSVTSRKSVLLVDTDRDLLLGLGLRLRTCGYQIHIAMDAISAVNLARDEGPDLVVMRLGILGHDAIPTLLRLQSMEPLALIPLVLLTDRALSPKDEALTSDTVAVFAKPVDFDEVVSTIVDALRESGEAISG